MKLPITIESLSKMHDQWISTWKQSAIIQLSESGFCRLVADNHRFNYQLWQAEDRARREDRGYEFVYRAKREIDQCNQERNNAMEAIDQYLFELLNPASKDSCPVHSETPGMMIDRLSILALKIFHMALQVKRADVNQSHIAKCQGKLTQLTAQRQQLNHCLHILLKEVELKTRTFCLYHQFKMYNDPTLNPELYLTQSS